MVHLDVDTIGSTNSSHRVSDVVISEINYNSTHVGEADTLEFIELFNQRDYAVDISGWRLDNAVSFVFPEGTVLAAKSLLVVVGFDPANLALLNAFKAAYSVGDDVTIIGPFTGSLSNGGERIVLERPDTPPTEEPLFTPYIAQDEVDYDDKNGWAISADGGGDSLHRVGGELYGNLSGSWQGLIPSPGQTGLIVVEGDYDGDGQVDSADLDIVKSGFGSAFSLSDLFAVRNNTPVVQPAMVINFESQDTADVLIENTLEATKNDQIVLFVGDVEMPVVTGKPVDFQSLDLGEAVVAESDIDAADGNGAETDIEIDRQAKRRVDVRLHRSLYDLLEEDLGVFGV